VTRSAAISLCSRCAGLERLGQQVVGARLHRGARRFLVGGAGEHEHVRVAGVAAGADRAHERGAVHARHLPVGDHDIRGLGLVGAPRAFAVLGDGAAMAEPLDGSADEQPRTGVVVGDQDVHVQE
jgi:hypothetical protein